MGLSPPVRLVDYAKSLQAPGPIGKAPSDVYEEASNQNAADGGISAATMAKLVERMEKLEASNLRLEAAKVNPSRLCDFRSISRCNSRFT